MRLNPYVLAVSVALLTAGAAPWSQSLAEAPVVAPSPEVLEHQQYWIEMRSKDLKYKVEDWVQTAEELKTFLEGLTEEDVEKIHTAVLPFLTMGIAEILMKLPNLKEVTFETEGAQEDAKQMLQKQEKLKLQEVSA